MGSPRIAASAVDRWVMREGWYYLRWTVNRRMVAFHDKIGWALIASAPVAAALVGFLVEPKGAAVGISLGAAGAVHLGVSNWVRKHDEVRDHHAPKLTPQAHRFLKKLVKECVGTDPLGQKYYLKLMRQSAENIREPAESRLNPTTFLAFEDLTSAYNRLMGSLTTDASDQTRLKDAAQIAMSQGIELVAHLDRFPELVESMTPKIAAIAKSLTQVAERLEAEAAQPVLAENLNAWVEVLTSASEPEKEEFTVRS